MFDPSRWGSAAQFRSLVRSMLVNPAGLFDLVFSADYLCEVVAAEVGKTLDRLFTPIVTLVIGDN
jgi:hypothetical protein